jgi:Flp pilus assembly secretin CpaC
VSARTGGTIVTRRTIRNVFIAATASLLIAVGAAAARADSAKSEHTVSLSLQAGETYVISDLNPSSTPAVKVIENPHALVLHAEEPGKLVLLGAESGHWAVSVTRSDGEAVTYNVQITSVATPGAPLEPGKSPAALGDTGLTGARPPASPSPAPSMGAAAAPPASTTVVAAAAAPPAAGANHTSPAPLAPLAAQPGQALEHSEQSNSVFRADPSVRDSTGYLSPSVSGGRHYLPADAIDLMTGTSQVIDFHRRLTRVSIADSKIADIQVVNPYQINLVGHAPGFTTLAVWDDQGNYEERQVRIDSGGKQQVLLNTMVAELNRQAIENQGVNLSMALTNYGVSLVGLPGPVATPYSPQSTVTAVLPNGTVLQGGSATLPPAGALIPMLLSQNLTYGLSAGNSQIQWQGLFQFLENHSMAKILAQPHLLANSGEQAKFLSGGEIPIVVAQALNTSIVFKQFGTSVDFVPTVVGKDEVELVVKPEVSQPDYTHGVQLFGFMVPSFVTRRAETMVRLQDHQTLIIAGLMLYQKQSVVQKVPYLGDVPYLGGLFRNTSYQDTESDLVMSVTPQIVRPIPPGGRVFAPTSSGPLTAQQIVTKRLAHPDAARPRF